MPRTIAGALLSAAALAQGACAPSLEPGRPRAESAAGARAAVTAGPGWAPARFERATEGCTQTWACDCSTVQPNAGCHVEPTGDTTTEGACAADRGHLNGCSRCLALPPEIECTCKTVCP